MHVCPESSLFQCSLFCETEQRMSDMRNSYILYWVCSCDITILLTVFLGLCMFGLLRSIYTYCLVLFLGIVQGMAFRKHYAGKTHVVNILHGVEFAKMLCDVS